MRRVTCIILLLLLCFTAYSQGDNLTNSQAEQGSEKIDIYFNLNSYALDSMYMNNRGSIQILLNLINSHLTDSITEIKKINISSYSSPDGALAVNKILSKNRTETIYRYLTNKCSIPNSLITVTDHGIAWDIMREHVIDSELSYKKEVLDIIYKVPAETWKRIEASDKWLTLVDSRNKHLMDLKQGEPYREMQKYIFPYLRKSSIEIIYIHNKPKPEPEIKVVVDTILNTKSDTIPIIENITSDEKIVVIETKKEKLPRNPLLAVKTNLACLGMGVSNIGVELPFKNNFSIDGLIYYSPYTIDYKWRIRLAIFQPEFRYWLSSSLDKHFFGLHAHVGLFNISKNEWTRYQNNTDQPLWGFGLSYGYAINLSRSLNLEFNVGAGYASLSYDSIYNVDNGATYSHTERGYWGLTRAGVSLSYIFNRK